MGHLFKYRLKAFLHSWECLLWPLLFPLILCTLFYVTFGMNKSNYNNLQVMPVAYVEQESTTENQQFHDYLLAMSKEGTLISLKELSENEALEALKSEEIEGIFYGGKALSLSVSASGLKQSILSELLSSYQKNADIILDIVMNHPENLEQAMEQMGNYSEMTREVSLGGKSIDNDLNYYFALIGMGCLYGCFLGLQVALDMQANLTQLGARKTLAPVHRINTIVSDLGATFLLHFINILILLGYMALLGLKLGDKIVPVLLVCAVGSVLGVAFGMFVGSFGKLKEGAKIAIVLSISMIMSFMAGLMFANMKNVVDKYAPLLNRLNPAALIADSFYCTTVYDNPARFIQNILILCGITVLLLTAAFFMVRRVRYQSLMDGKGGAI